MSDLSALKIIGHQREHRLHRSNSRQRRLTHIGLGQPDKGFKQTLKKPAFNAFAFKPHITHGLKKKALLGIVLRLVCHFEKGGVSVFKQHLQIVSELLGSLVMNLQQDHRQAGICVE